MFGNYSPILYSKPLKTNIVTCFSYYMETHTIRKGNDLSVDVYSQFEQTQQNIAYFEGKNGKQKIHNFVNAESLNGTHLALWAFGQVYLQKQLHNKASRLAREVAQN